MTQALASPCIDICRMDDRTGFCLGCFRTIDEIVAWSAASNDQRRKILVGIERRRCAAAGDFPGEGER